MPRQSSPFPSAAELDNGFKLTQKQVPKWTMRMKPEMVIGASIPSWVNSIPGPKYTYSTDMFKPRQPVYTMTGRPKSSEENGETTKSAANLPTLDQYCKAEKSLSRNRSSPHFSFSSQDRWKGRSKSEANPDFLDPAKAGDAVRGRLGAGKGPHYSIAARLPTEGELMSVRSPGPVYNQDNKEQSRAASIGKRLPTEGDIMSVRSPGPCNYGGSAVDVKQQSEVDSTKKKSFSCSFGIGSRWEGPTSEMIASGALTRYERGRYLGLKP
jgi:hypothetical protein